MNLLQETLQSLKENGKTSQDVVWVGNQDGHYSITWAEFSAIAEKTTYSSGFGNQEIASDLVIVGENWWLERHEYDGSEWWEYKELPHVSKSAKSFTKVYDDALSSATLEDINKAVE